MDDLDVKTTSGRSTKYDAAEVFRDNLRRAFKGIENMLFSRVTVISILLMSCPVLRANADDPFVVGLSIPLTGEAGEAGIAARNGIEMARAENSEAFRKFRFVYEDNKYDGSNGVSTFTKLTSIDKANLVFMWGDTPALAAAPLAQRRQIPMIAALTDHVSVKGNPYVIRFINSYDQYADVLIDYFRYKKIRHVGAVVVELAYYVNFFDAIQSRMTGDSQVTLVAKVLPDATDFRSIAAGLRSRNYDSLGFLVLPGQITLLFKQLQSLGIRISPFGADDFESDAIAKDVGAAIDGSVYSMNIVTDDFRTRYVARFGNDSYVPYAANSYEFAKLLLALRLNEGSPDSQELLRRLTSFTGGPGAMGNYYFCKDPVHGQYFYFPIVVKSVAGRMRQVVFGNPEPSGCP